MACGNIMTKDILPKAVKKGWYEMETKIYKEMMRMRKYVSAVVNFKNVPEYMNMCIADALASGVKNKMDDDWLRRFLLNGFEEKFIKYDEALALFPIYKKIISEY